MSTPQQPQSQPQPRTSSGMHDRRGFDVWLRLHLACMVLAIVLLVLYSWKIGLALLLYSCMAFIVLEAVSAPPVNHVRAFQYYLRHRYDDGSRKPVLLCLGDSLTHGTMSASITPLIPFALSEALGLPPPQTGSFFLDPVWVVNAGQNGITSHTVLNERLHPGLNCFPDFILLWIGTNDLLSIYSPNTWGKRIASINQLPQVPTMEVLERNLTNILNHLYQATPLSYVGVCTLPPISENLDSAVNRDIVREANDMIQRVVANAPSAKVRVVPIYDKLESVIEKNKSKGSAVEWIMPVAMLQCALYYLSRGALSWNFVSSLVGNTVLSDGLHLNERGADIVVQTIVEWLIQANVAKAIAVKQYR